MEVAVIGIGFIGGVHLRAARQAGARLRAVGGGSVADAEEAARLHGAERAYTTPEEVAGDERIDVVHVCTPNAAHAAYARAALEAGKHVICEKPLGIDLAEARALSRLAASAGTVAAVPFAYRYHPMARELRARTRAGELGALQLVHGGYLQDWLADRGARNWRMDAASGGASRAFADVGSHWCDLAEFATGDRIAAVNALLRRRGGTDDAAVLQFETVGGATGSLLVSQISRGHRNRLLLEVDGTIASARFDQERPDELVVSDAGGDRVLQRGTPGLSQEAQALTLVPAGHPQGFLDAFGQFVAAAYDAVRSGRPEGDGTLPTFADGERSAAIVDAVLRSAETRDWAEVTG